LDKIVKIFATPNELAEKFAEEMAGMIIESAKKKQLINIALSGGSTPELLFTLLAENYSSSVPWQYVHLFWGDERCVPPENVESNYGMTRKLLLSKIDIPTINIHRIRGEDDPVMEACRYSDELSLHTLKRDSLPLFDLVLLGLGEDGHTASIFPGQMDLMESEKNCAVSFHPVTKQKRITITGRVINNAEQVIFLVTGRKKEAIVEKIVKRRPSAENFPASYIVPVHGRISWFLDRDAGNLL
jgi:6-phosphogluconolactonase